MEISEAFKKIDLDKKEIAELLEREFNIQGLFDSRGNAIPLKYWKDIIRINTK